MILDQNSPVHSVSESRGGGVPWALHTNRDIWDVKIFRLINDADFNGLNVGWWGQCSAEIISPKHQRLSKTQTTPRGSSMVGQGLVSGGGISVPTLGPFPAPSIYSSCFFALLNLPCGAIICFSVHHRHIGPTKLLNYLGTSAVCMALIRKVRTGDGTYQEGLDMWLKWQGRSWQVTVWTMKFRTSDWCEQQIQNRFLQWSGRLQCLGQVMEGNGKDRIGDYRDHEDQ